MTRIRIVPGALGLALGFMAYASSAVANPATANTAAVAGASATEATTSAASEALDAPDARSPTLGWSAAYASRYSFQGLDYSEGSPVFQPSATVSLRGFTAGLWGNVDQTRGELNEIDATLQREFKRGPLSGALGYAHLRYPHREGWTPTHETYLDLSFDAPLAPSLGVHWDVDAGAGRYWTLGAGHEFENARGTLGLSAKLYAHEHYYGMTGIPAFETGISFSSAVGMLAIQPALARVWAWENGHFRDDLAIDAGWVASLNVSPK